MHLLCLTTNSILTFFVCCGDLALVWAHCGTKEDIIISALLHRAEVAIPVAAGHACEIYISICFLEAQDAGRLTWGTHWFPLLLCYRCFSHLFVKDVVFFQCFFMLYMFVFKSFGLYESHIFKIFPAGLYIPYSGFILIVLLWVAFNS